MRKNNVLMLLGGVALGVVLATVLASSAANNSVMGMRPSPARMNSNMDQHFIEQMIPHHDNAITMANIALKKAEHQEIKTLAQNIINSQSKEIAEMRQWYKDWFNQDVPDAFASMGHGMSSGTMHMGMMEDVTDTQKLESANPFDKAFIEEMIPHHQMAVMMAQMLKSSTQRSEMKKLAEDIITAQNKEIGQMRGWHDQWYR